MGKKMAAAAAMACALAGWANGAQAMARVVTPSATTTVTDLGDGAFAYSVLVTGNSGIGDAQFLSDFYLPWLPDMGVANVGGSDEWTYSVEPTHDVFGIGGGAMHFHVYDATDCGGCGFSYVEADFTFTANYGGTEGPFHSVLWDSVTGLPVEIWGDPLIPASPDTLKALLAVPEPAAASAMLAGMALLAAARRRRGHAAAR